MEESDVRSEFNCGGISFGKTVGDANSKIRPEYYMCGDGEDVIDIIGKLFGSYMEIGFIQGCIIKYLARWGSKDGINDLKKAREYLDRLIEIVEEAK